MEPLETRRLLLRPLTPEDLDGLHALYGRPELMRFITGRPRTLAETRSRLARHLADHRLHGFGLCAAILKEGGEMVGRCGLEPVSGPHGLEGDLAWMFHVE